MPGRTRGKMFDITPETGVEDSGTGSYPGYPGYGESDVDPYDAYEDHYAEQDARRAPGPPARPPAARRPADAAPPAARRPAAGPRGTGRPQESAAATTAVRAVRPAPDAARPPAGRGAAVAPDGRWDADEPPLLSHRGAGEEPAYARDRTPQGFDGGDPDDPAWGRRPAPGGDEFDDEFDEGEDAYDDDEYGVGDAPLSVPPPGRGGRPLGPADVEELDPSMTDALARVDLGAVQVPVPYGAELKLEPAGAERPQAVHLLLPEGRIAVSALAAPRSSGLWADLAAEIEQSLRKGGARVRNARGDWGRELHARTENAASVFVGCDGPRWMVYGVATASLETVDALDVELRRVLRGIIVVRGKSPYPPRTVLPLELPEHLREEQPEVAPQKPSITVSVPRPADATGATPAATIGAGRVPDAAATTANRVPDAAATTANRVPDAAATGANRAPGAARTGAGRVPDARPAAATGANRRPDAPADAPSRRAPAPAARRDAGEDPRTRALPAVPRRGPGPLDEEPARTGRTGWSAPEGTPGDTGRTGWSAPEGTPGDTGRTGRPAPEDEPGRARPAASGGPLGPADGTGEHLPAAPAAEHGRLGRRPGRPDRPDRTDGRRGRAPDRPAPRPAARIPEPDRTPEQPRPTEQSRPTEQPRPTEGPGRTERSRRAEPPRGPEPRHAPPPASAPDAPRVAASAQPVVEPGPDPAPPVRRDPAVISLSTEDMLAGTEAAPERARPVRGRPERTRSERRAPAGAVPDAQTGAGTDAAAGNDAAGRAGGRRSRRRHDPVADAGRIDAADLLAGRAGADPRDGTPPDRPQPDLPDVLGAGGHDRAAEPRPAGPLAIEDIPLSDVPLMEATLDREPEPEPEPLPRAGTGSPNGSGAGSAPLPQRARRRPARGDDDWLSAEIAASRRAGRHGSGTSVADLLASAALDDGIAAGGRRRAGADRAPQPEPEPEPAPRVPDTGGDDLFRASSSSYLEGGPSTADEARSALQDLLRSASGGPGDGDRNGHGVTGLADYRASRAAATRRNGHATDPGRGTAGDPLDGHERAAGGSGLTGQWSSSGRRGTDDDPGDLGRHRRD